MFNNCPPPLSPPRLCMYVRMYVQSTVLTNAGFTSARKYQFMELNTQRRAVSLRDKIPDIQKTLDTVRFLRARKVRPDLT